MTEHVLVIPRTELEKQNVGTSGIYPFDLNLINEMSHGFLSRDLIDDKSDYSVSIGKLLPQLVAYLQIVDSNGRILTYQRKGKEEGLLGKTSIGIGGHISIDDSIRYDQNEERIYLESDFKKIMMESILRELEEEIGLFLQGTITPEMFTRIISTDVDKTAQVHVGLTLDLVIDDVADLEYDPAELNNVRWLTREELKSELGTTNFEPWTAALISEM